MPASALTLDAWSGIAHKPGLNGSRAGSALEPTWIRGHERRLDAYRILAAYVANQARHFLETADANLINARREFGDAALLVKVAKAALLGDDVSISVEGAGATETEDKALTAEERFANERQEWLDAWADDERLRSKLEEGETNAVKLGDAVYALGWSVKKRRPRLYTYDPGFYFPRLDPFGADEDFPSWVDVAWEIETVPPDDRSQSERFVRRKTWELRELPRGETRRYPWNEEPSNLYCAMTHGIWRLEDIGSRRVGMEWPKGEYLRNENGQELRAIDIGTDFIPVVHVPNTVAGAEHYGESILLSVAQILDELSAGDTDTAAAAALACVPMLGLEGEMASTTTEVRAGAVFGGKITVVDLSASLTAAMAYVDRLKDRLSENARIPAEVLGRVKASEVEAGIIMALAFGPLRSLVGDMRLTRAEKHPLITRFAQRLAMANGALEGPELRAEIRFGSFLPTDQGSIVETTLKLWDAKLVSRETAIRRLLEAGVIDVDLAEELKACRAEDFGEALALLEALGDDDSARNEVWQFLGRERPAPQQRGPNEPAINPTVPLVGGPGAAQRNRQAGFGFGNFGGANAGEEE